MQEEVQDMKVDNKNLMQNLDAVVGYLCIALVELGEMD